MGIFNFRKPVLMIVFLNIIGYGVLCFLNGQFNLEVLYAGVIVTVVLCVCYGILGKMSLRDQYIFLIISMLFSVGELMLYRLDPYFGVRQIVWMLISVVLFFVVYFSIMKLDIWEHIHYGYYIVALLLFIVTIIFGTSVGGSKNWIIIGQVSIQPSEIIKLLVIFILADRYAFPEKYRFKNIHEDIMCSVIVYSLLGCMVIQKEWGTAVLIFLVHISLMFIFNTDIKVMILNIVCAIAGGYMGFLFVSHIKVRVDTWLDPWSDMAGKGYQITQSLFAIGSGGFFGTGLGLGSPDYIPEVHSDFVFSAICEEFGILGGIAIIMLFFILVYRGMRLAMKIDNIFYKCLATGISTMFGYQAFIILGGVTKFIPLTGITLPFVSYGGSSLLISFVAIAVLEAVANKVVQEEQVIE